MFLVEGREPILVDAGTGEHSAETLRALAGITELPKLRTIILTHRHYDHVGGASQLAAKLGAEVYIHEKDAEVVRNGDGWGTLSTMFGKAMDAVDVIPISEGRMFSTGDHDLKVIHTPGHSIGSICLYDRETQELISGDTVFVGGVGRWDLPTGDLDALVSSIRALQSLDVRSIFPGHGPCAVGNGNEQIAQALNCLGES